MVIYLSTSILVYLKEGFSMNIMVVIALGVFANIHGIYFSWQIR